LTESLFPVQTSCSAWLSLWHTLLPYGNPDICCDALHICQHPILTKHVRTTSIVGSNVKINL